MVNAELSSYLEENEKDVILRAIAPNDKIIASGICQYLNSHSGTWIKAPGAAVALFLKNSVERRYRITIIEPLSESEWESPILFDFIIKEKHFETIQTHANLLVFEADSKQIGIHFYDSKECLQFHNCVCKQQNAKAAADNGQQEAQGKNGKQKKKKRTLFTFNFMHKQPKKTQDIGQPTDFKHLNSVKMTEGQEDLYLTFKSMVKTNGEADDEFLKRFVIGNEDNLRKSMMVKKESKTVKTVKDKGKEKGKSKRWWNSSKSNTEDISPRVAPVSVSPVDPLNPDWSTEGSTQASPSFAPATSHRSASTITVASSFKHSHTFAAEPIKSREWDTPRKDTFGVQNKREPQNIYRFEPEQSGQKLENREIEERAPEVPSRSTSRSVREHRAVAEPSQQPVTAHHVLPSIPSSISTPPPLPSISTPPPLPSISTPSPLPSISTPPPLPSISTPPPLASISTPPPLPSIVAPPPPAPPILPHYGIENPEGTMHRPASVPDSSTGRKSLMDEIRSADRSKVLRKVSDSPDTQNSAVAPTSETIIDQIQRVLNRRRCGINPSDSEESEDSDDDDDDDEWSD